MLRLSCNERTKDVDAARLVDDMPNHSAGSIRVGHVQLQHMTLLLKAIQQDQLASSCIHCAPLGGQLLAEGIPNATFAAACDEHNTV
jgi:hypothetical protein